MDQTQDQTTEPTVPLPLSEPVSGAYTLEQYAALRGAIAQGAMSVRYGDKEIRYRTLAEMEKILSNMQSELFPQSRTASARVIHPTFSKGA